MEHFFQVLKALLTDPMIILFRTITVTLHIRHKLFRTKLTMFMPECLYFLPLQKGFSPMHCPHKFFCLLFYLLIKIVFCLIRE